MRREQSIVGNYYRLKPQARLDKIYTNFDNFPGIIADYEYEMAEWIKGNLAKARRDAVGELGVRVQTSNFRRSITEDRAIENLEVERIIRETDLEDSSWDRIEDSDEIMRGLLEISLMRREYKRFKSRLRRLSSPNKEIFQNYICHKKRMHALSAEIEIMDDSVRKRIYRIKKQVYSGFVENLDCYDDNTIFELEIYEEEN